MRRQGIDGIEFAFQPLVVQLGMHVRMARATQQRNALLHFSAVEIALVPPILVPRLGDQVVTGQHAHVSPAQLARSPTSYSTSVLHGSKHDPRPFMSRQSGASIRQAW